MGGSQSREDLACNAAEKVLTSILECQQEKGTGFEQALKEIEAGRKTSHWMWYIWPSVASVRTTSKPHLLLPGLLGAQLMLRHPVLGPRLIKITTAALAHLQHGTSVMDLLGSKIDECKFHEAIAIFKFAAENAQLSPAVFQKALDFGFGGKLPLTVNFPYRAWLIQRMNFHTGEMLGIFSEAHPEIRGYFTSDKILFKTRGDTYEDARTAMQIYYVKRKDMQLTQ